MSAEVSSPHGVDAMVRFETPDRGVGSTGDDNNLRRSGCLSVFVRTHGTEGREGRSARPVTARKIAAPSVRTMDAESYGGALALVWLTADPDCCRPGAEPGRSAAFSGGTLTRRAGSSCAQVCTNAMKWMLAAYAAQKTNPPQPHAHAHIGAWRVRQPTVRMRMQRRGSLRAEQRPKLPPFLLVTGLCVAIVLAVLFESMK